MKKALVTGATGFIGWQALPLLVERGYEIHAPYIGPEPVPLEGVRWHPADLMDADAVEKLLHNVGPSHLLHLAWYAVHGLFWTSHENLFWLSASLRLLDLFKRHGGERFVMAGTCAEYDWAGGVCNEGSTALQPATLYGACKHSLQVVSASYARQNELSGAWGRIFHLFGPREDPNRLVSFVIRSLLSGKVAETTSCNQERDLLYVEDVARAFVDLLESGVQGPVNIGSGTPVALRALVLRIGSMIGRPELIRLGARPDAPNDPMLLIADTRRLRQEVGWEPRWNLGDGIAKCIEYWKLQLKNG